MVYWHKQTYKKVGERGQAYDLKVSFKPINPDGAPNVYRRSMYTYWKDRPTPVMMALDASKGMSARLDGKNGPPANL